MPITTYDLIYTAIWATVGSILGFCAFRLNPTMSWQVKVCQCILSISIGILLALPLTEYLNEVKTFPKRLSMMLGALGAFGGPDFILRYYPKLTQALAQLLENFALAKVKKNEND